MIVRLQIAMQGAQNGITACVGITDKQ